MKQLWVFIGQCLYCWNETHISKGKLLLVANLNSLQFHIGQCVSLLASCPWSNSVSYAHPIRRQCRDQDTGDLAPPHSEITSWQKSLHKDLLEALLYLPSIRIQYVLCVMQGFWHIELPESAANCNHLLGLLVKSQLSSKSFVENSFRPSLLRLDGKIRLFLCFCATRWWLVRDCR